MLCRLAVLTVAAVSFGCVSSPGGAPAISPSPIASAALSKQIFENISIKINGDFRSIGRDVVTQGIDDTTVQYHIGGVPGSGAPGEHWYAIVTVQGKGKSPISEDFSTSDVQGISVSLRQDKGTGASAVYTSAGGEAAPTYSVWADKLDLFYKNQIIRITGDLEPVKADVELSITGLPLR